MSLFLVISVVVGGLDDDVVDYVLDDVGPEVVVVGASVVLGGEEDDVVDVVGTVSYLHRSYPHSY